MQHLATAPARNARRNGCSYKYRSFNFRNLQLTDQYLYIIIGGHIWRWRARCLAICKEQ